VSLLVSWRREIWSFTYAKQRNVEKAPKAPTHADDTWTWTGIDADCKPRVWRTACSSRATAVRRPHSTLSSFEQSRLPTSGIISA